MKRIRFAFSLNTIGVFFFGMALACAVFFGLETQNEHNFLDRVISKIDGNIAMVKDSEREEQFVKEAVHYTYYLLKRRTEIFSATGDEIPLKQRVFHSPIRASIDGYGDCGGYSTFLMALLDRKGYRVRPVQLKVNGVYGGHITVCVNLHGKQVLVDPLYDEVFTDANGHLSDIRQVSSHWAYYQARITNPDYRPEYEYSQGYRFSNWDKLGFVTKGIYSGLRWVGGKQWAESLSVHQYIMDTYFNGFIFSALYVLAFLFLNANKIMPRLRRYFLRDIKVSFPKDTSKRVLQPSKAA